MGILCWLKQAHRPQMPREHLRLQICVMTLEQPTQSSSWHLSRHLIRPCMGTPFLHDVPEQHPPVSSLLRALGNYLGHRPHFRADGGHSLVSIPQSVVPRKLRERGAPWVLLLHVWCGGSQEAHGWVLLGRFSARCSAVSGEVFICIPQLRNGGSPSYNRTQ